MFKLLLLSLLAISVSCERMVLAGGALSLSNDNVYEEFIRLSTRPDGRIKIGVNSAASSGSSAASTAQQQINNFRNRYGIQDVEFVPIHLNNRDAAYSQEVVDQMLSFTGIYFTGGQSYYIRDCFLPDYVDTPVLAAMRRQFESDQLAVAGSSAGLTIMVLDALTFNQPKSYIALKYGVVQSWGPQNDRRVYDIDGGFGFFKYCQLSMHYSYRGYQGDFVQLIGQLVVEGKSSTCRGIAVEEDSAIVVENGVATVTGLDNGAKFHGAYYLDMCESRYNVDGYQWHNVKTSFLTEGDKIDLNTFEITIRSDKANIAGNESRTDPLAPSNDIFNDAAFAQPEILTRHFLALVDSSNADSTYGTTTQSNPRYTVVMEKGNGTGYKAGDLISFTDMVMHIESDGLFVDNLEEDYSNYKQYEEY